MATLMAVLPGVSPQLIECQIIGVAHWLMDRVKKSVLIRLISMSIARPTAKGVPNHFGNPATSPRRREPRSWSRNQIGEKKKKTQLSRSSEFPEIHSKQYPLDDRSPALDADCETCEPEVMVGPWTPPSSSFAVIVRRKADLGSEES